MRFNIVNILFHRHSTGRQRCIALCNVVGVVYFWLIYISNSLLMLRKVLPTLYSGNCLLLHYIISIYIAANVSINYRKTLSTNTETPLCHRNSNLSRNKKRQLQCKKCYHEKTVRSHHCWLCDVCISKQDHHCFIMGTCIGLHNQKYFIVYCFYQFIAGFYFLVNMALFLFVTFQFSFDLHLFLTIPTTALFTFFMQPERGSLYFFCCIALMYSTLLAMLVGLILFLWQLYLISCGLTNYEATTTGLSTATQPDSLSERILAVFPKGVIVQFLYPIHHDLSEEVDFSGEKLK